MSRAKARPSRPAPPQDTAQLAELTKGGTAHGGTGHHTRPGIPESLSALRQRPARRAVARTARPPRKFEHRASANAAERMHNHSVDTIASVHGKRRGTGERQRHSAPAQHSPPTPGPAPRTPFSTAPMPQYPCSTPAAARGPLTAPHTPPARARGCGWWGGGEGPPMQSRPDAAAQGTAR